MLRFDPSQKSMVHFIYFHGFRRTAAAAPCRDSNRSNRTGQQLENFRATSQVQPSKPQRLVPRAELPQNGRGASSAAPGRCWRLCREPRYSGPALLNLGLTRFRPSRCPGRASIAVSESRAESPAVHGSTSTACSSIVVPAESTLVRQDVINTSRGRACWWNS